MYFVRPRRSGLNTNALALDMQSVGLTDSIVAVQKLKESQLAKAPRYPPKAYPVSRF